MTTVPLLLKKKGYEPNELWRREYSASDGVTVAIQRLENNKASGYDSLPAKLFKIEGDKLVKAEYALKKFGQGLEPHHQLQNAFLSELNFVMYFIGGNENFF